MQEVSSLCHALNSPLLLKTPPPSLWMRFPTRCCSYGAPMASLPFQSPFQTTLPNPTPTPLGDVHTSS